MTNLLTIIISIGAILIGVLICSFFVVLAANKEYIWDLFDFVDDNIKDKNNKI